MKGDQCFNSGCAGCDDCVDDERTCDTVVFGQWQPIETAPKGGRILMLMKHGAIEGTWDGETGSGYYWRHMEWYPTHWMPLPKPPGGSA